MLICNDELKEDASRLLEEMNKLDNPDFKGETLTLNECWLEIKTFLGKIQ